MRFGVDVKVAPQSVKVGQPIRVDVTYTALLPASDIIFSIVAPEITVASRNGWKGGHFPETAAIDKLLLDRVSLGGGQTFSQHATVVVQAPGYYRIAATANAVNVPERSVDGRPIQNFVGAEQWLLVTGEGGRVTPTFDSSLIPGEFRKQPGPFVLRSSPRPATVAAGSLAAGQRSVATQASAALTPNALSGRLIYYDYEVNRYEGVKNVEVSVQGFDEYAQALAGGFITSTGEDGYYTVPCPSEVSLRYDITLKLNNARFWVDNGNYDGGSLHQWDCGPDGIGGDGILDSNTGFAWNVLSRVADAAYTLFGIQRNRVYVTTGTMWPITAYNPENPWYAAGTTDRIEVSTSGLAQFRAYGHFALAHEYGHALHHRALGGYPTTSTNCPKPHGWAIDEDMTCTYVEGFADFFGAYVLPAAETGEGASVERNAYYTDFWAAGTDGSRIEGAVAAFLYDVVDPANESFDTVAYPASYLAAVMQTCNVWNGLQNGRPYRINQLIYCLGHDIDPASTQTYFPTDVLWYGYSESAAEPPGWSSSAIRTLWLRNLRGQ